MFNYVALNSELVYSLILVRMDTFTSTSHSDGYISQYWFIFIGCNNYLPVCLSVAYTQYSLYTCIYISFQGKVLAIRPQPLKTTNSLLALKDNVYSIQPTTLITVNPIRKKILRPSLGSQPLVHPCLPGLTH